MAKKEIKTMPADYIADKVDKEKFKKPITGGERLATAELLSTIVDVVKSKPNLAKEEKKEIVRSCSL